MSSILELKQNPKRIFNIFELKKKFKILEKNLLKINSEWYDIQYLNLLSHYILSNIDEVEKNSFFGLNIIDSLKVIAKDFYIHFSVIYIMFEKINKDTDKDQNINKLFLQFQKEFKTNIQIVRNEVILHKEKPTYRDSYFTVFDTSGGGMALSIYASGNNKDSKETEFKLKPFVDAKRIEEYLIKLKKIVENK
jgi:hypothetical protein